MTVGVISQRNLFRKALCALLAGTGIFGCVMEFENVLGPAGNHDTSDQLVLVVHVADPGIGIKSIHQLQDLLPQARCVLLSDDPSEEFCVQALEAGAWGCVSTSEGPQLLQKALLTVSGGNRWFDPRVANRIIERVASSHEPSPRLKENLTPREWEVLRLLAKGCSDKDVATSLFISRGTAHSHLKSIYRKLQVKTRHAAAVYFFEHAKAQNGPVAIPQTVKAAGLS